VFLARCRVDVSNVQRFDIHRRCSDKD
jgi:hypothetical protein